jgi:membrane protein implicated in regulation of membrane protease activity
MGLVYLFALVVGLGTLLVQIAMGLKGDAHAEGEPELEAGGHGDHAGPAGSKDIGHAGPTGSKDIGKAVDSGEAGALSLFLSTRFWIFAALAFGMSGSLIHVFELAGTIATLVIASLTGIGSGLFAVLAFRAIKRAANTTISHASDAVGQVGRVLVACGKGRKGQVRVELRGHSVDLLATTDDEAISRGELILVEDVQGGVAHVSRRPPELE